MKSAGVWSACRDESTMKVISERGEVLRAGRAVLGWHHGGPGWISSQANIAASLRRCR